MTLNWNKQIKKRVIKAAQKGLLRVGTEVFNNSQKLVPFDDGELSLGARLSSEGLGSDDFNVVVSYGNNPTSAEYAVIQHENLGYHHNPPEQAKYLEKPFLDILSEYEDMMRYVIRNEVNI